MNASDTPMVPLDQLEAIELVEICEFIDAWLADAPDAAASYDRHVGWPGSADELRRELRRLAELLATTAPVAQP